MADLQNSRVAGAMPTTGLRRAMLAGVGLVVVYLCSRYAGKEEELWLPGFGVGLVLVAWLGQGMVPLLAVALYLARGFFRVDHPPIRILGDSLLPAIEMGLSWWVYAQVAKGTRRLEDPRSATVFLILVPGALAAAGASIQALYWGWDAGATASFWEQVSRLWISRALGILTIAPPLLVVATPYLIRYGLTRPEPAIKLPGGTAPPDWTWGEVIETTGLCLGTGILAPVLVFMQTRQGSPAWTLWGFSLLLIVWSGLRQGLRGGSLAASASAVPALVCCLWYGGVDFSPVQGNLLAQCSTALLVGASAGWIRASEARYRQMVGHIPVVLYSARLPRGLAAAPPSKIVPGGPATNHAKVDHPLSGPTIVHQAEVTLVGPACRAVFDCSPEDLLGPYAAWLERIDPADRELVIAALGQLCLQDHPVTCEYRVLGHVPAGAAVAVVRWVRDTMVAYHSSDSPRTLNGWEGVIEDITEQRALAQNLRRTNGMLQALVTYMPTGVFFVQMPHGQPIMVNQRARQLLGQREDPAAGITHLSEVYRLHRPDGTLYPVEDLPVAKALRSGTTSMANDIVIHRADGRRVPLITWAAPIDWTGKGNPDAAVWVLEDMSALQQAETARLETEARLRAVIETMAEGVVVQNQSGVIIECNPAACTILGLNQEELLGRVALGPEVGCLREDGSPFPRRTS